MNNSTDIYIVPYISLHIWYLFLFVLQQLASESCFQPFSDLTFSSAFYRPSLIEEEKYGMGPRAA